MSRRKVVMAQPSSSAAWPVVNSTAIAPISEL